MIRLDDMATVRALTMATVIQANWCDVGSPSAASTIPV